MWIDWCLAVYHLRPLCGHFYLYISRQILIKSSLLCYEIDVNQSIMHKVSRCLQFCGTILISIVFVIIVLIIILIITIIIGVLGSVVLSSSFESQIVCVFIQILLEDSIPKIDSSLQVRIIVVIVLISVETNIRIYSNIRIFASEYWYSYSICGLFQNPNIIRIFEYFGLNIQKLFDGKILEFFRNKDKTRLPASRSSSIGPVGCFLFLHPKIKVKETITLNQTQP